MSTDSGFYIQRKYPNFSIWINYTVKIERKSWKNLSGINEGWML